MGGLSKMSTLKTVGLQHKINMTENINCKVVFMISVKSTFLNIRYRSRFFEANSKYLTRVPN